MIGHDMFRNVGDNGRSRPELETAYTRPKRGTPIDITLRQTFLLSFIEIGRVV